MDVEQAVSDSITGLITPDGFRVRVDDVIRQVAMDRILAPVRVEVYETARLQLAAAMAVADAELDRLGVEIAAANAAEVEARRIHADANTDWQREYEVNRKRDLGVMTETARRNLFRARELQNKLKHDYDETNKRRHLLANALAALR